MSLAGQILTALLAGLVYGFTHYLKKVQKGQEFDPWKLASTEVIAVVVALTLALNGKAVTQLTWGQQFAVYAGTIPIVENILKAIYRALTKQEPKRPQNSKPNVKLVAVQKRTSPPTG